MISDNWLDIAIYAKSLSEKSDPDASQQAIELFQRAINMRPDKAWPYIKYIELSDITTDDQLYYLNIANTTEPNNLWVHIKLLNIYLDTQNLEQAQRVYTTITNHILPNKPVSMDELLVVDKLAKNLSLMSKIKELKNTSILCSTLCFYENDYDSTNLAQLIHCAAEFKTKYGINIEISIRNNSNTFSQNLDNLIALEPNIPVIIHASHNLGFGLGHNTNLLNQPYDYYLILNDDIYFDNLDWLCAGLLEFKNNTRVGIVGGINNPSVVDKYGYGYFYREGLARDYVDGSIMLIQSDVFNKLNGFDHNTYDYFYFEDVDICLRARQQGYELGYIDIPHTHHRSSTTSNIPAPTIRSIVESNRAKFITKWNNYLNKPIPRRLTNKQLILLTLDGIGDIVDCFFPISSLLDGNVTQQIDLYCSNKKIEFIYSCLHKLNLLEDSPDLSEYDTVYSANHINFSYPMHTLDLISGALGVQELNTEASHIKKYISKLNIDSTSVIPDQKYIVVHLDSQRKSFHARSPKTHKLLPALTSLISLGYYLCVIGQNSDCEDLELFIEQNKAKIYDKRNISIQDTAIIINNATLFFGIDSGPSHIAQLCDIPTYIIYGPVHPLTKIYRLHNSGCYFKNDHSSGLYHKNLQPSYYYDLSKTEGCIDIDGDHLAEHLINFINNGFKFDWSPYYESLRCLQRHIVNIYLQNPVIQQYNPIKQQSMNIKDHTDTFIHIDNIAKI